MKGLTTHTDRREARQTWLASLSSLVPVLLLIFIDVHHQRENVCTFVSPLF